MQSGELSASDESVLSGWPSGETGIDVLEAGRVRASVLANAGIGKLSSSTPKRRRQAFAAPSLPVWSSAGPGASSAGPRPTWGWKTVGAQPTATAQPTQTPGGSHSHGHHGHGGNGGSGGFPFGWF